MTIFFSRTNSKGTALLVPNNSCHYVVEKVERAIVLMEGKTTAALERIEERLDRLEAASIIADPAPFENVSVN